MILFIYAGLIFLVLRFSVTLFNFLSNPKLGYYGKHYTDKVSIIIFSDPEDDHSQLLKSIEEQDYKHVEIFVKNAKERINDITDLATGKYLLFLKGKLSTGKGLINNLIYRAKVYDLALISLVPNRKFNGFFDRCIYPLNDFVLMNIFPMRLIRLINIPAFSVASQPCMFFNADKYRQNLVSENQGKTKMELLQANGFVHLEDKSDTGSVGKGLLRIFGNNVFAASIYTLLVVFCPIVMAVNFDPAFLALPVGLIFLTRVMISFLTAQNQVVNLLLHPLQVVMLVVVMIKAITIRVLTLTRQKN
ncbi:MAG TPA: hypothetical protein VK541_22430 [Pedobacter sp.]|uniref:hypothetical protein n=1 Tax=Pedobacter sp. TaxID=1411316 RepID=UPI002C92F995|nr:hypothetical protein [Pedobacter sp.]HMI05262.1 hypothetical protein [Pedobacter sp.]